MKKNSTGFKSSLIFILLILFFFQNCSEDTKFSKISESASVAQVPEEDAPEEIPQPVSTPFYGPLKVYRKSYYKFDGGLTMITSASCLSHGLQTLSGRCTLSVDDPNFNIEDSDFRIESSIDQGTQTCIFMGINSTNKSITVRVTAEVQCEMSPIPLPYETHTSCHEILSAVIPAIERTECDEIDIN